jgi:hypothetical protein
MQLVRTSPSSSRRGPQASIFAALFLAPLLLGGVGCKRKHVPADSIEELGYPTCPTSSAAALASGSGSAGAAPTAPTLVAQGDLRSGKNDTRGMVVEHYRIEKRDCLIVATVRQEWPHQIADVEAVFDADGLPLRVWRRWTNPLSRRPDGNADVKRFDFRTPTVSAKHQNDSGVVDFEHIHGPKPRALIGSGHGLLTVWIQRAHLEVGQKLRESAFDFRGVETAKEVTLMRQPDRVEESLGRTVRVYTIYGREAVFTDEHDVVIGDLAGLVPWDLSTLPAPPPMPTFQPADPRTTP